MAEVENEASPPSSRQGRTSPVGASFPWILPLGARFSRGKLRCGKFVPHVRMTEWPRSRPRPVAPICKHHLVTLPNGALGTPPFCLILPLKRRFWTSRFCIVNRVCPSGLSFSEPAMRGSRSSFIAQGRGLGPSQPSAVAAWPAPKMMRPKSRFGQILFTTENPWFRVGLGPIKGGLLFGLVSAARAETFQRRTAAAG